MQQLAPKTLEPNSVNRSSLAGVFEDNLSLDKKGIQKFFKLLGRDQFSKIKTRLPDLIDQL
jgi:hypothetical protein